MRIGGTFREGLVYCTTKREALEMRRDWGGFAIRLGKRNYVWAADDYAAAEMIERWCFSTDEAHRVARCALWTYQRAPVMTEDTVRRALSR